MKPQPICVFIVSLAFLVLLMSFPTNSIHGVAVGSSESIVWQDSGESYWKAYLVPPSEVTAFFTDVSTQAGINRIGKVWGVNWGDFDSDGWLDLFAGHHQQSPSLYHNNGNGTFTDVLTSSGIASEGDRHGAAWGDYDNDSLGAKVWVTAGGRTQFRELQDESPHFAHYSGPLHVGLGANAVADEVRIDWPSGITQILANVQADQLLILYESELPPGTLFVATDGKDTNDCTSPDNACRTVQRAVDVAAEGETIRVARGVYADRDTNNVGYVVALTKSVALQGGYDTTFADPPDPVANPTTLDAQGQGRVVYIAGDISPAIKGLRITGGDATGLGGGREGEDVGGGVNVISATATIRDNWVFGNTAGLGGGLSLRQSASTLSGNTISSNTAIGGGGLLLVESAATLSENTVTFNPAVFGGGLLLQNSTATLNGNTISSNTADQLGGGLLSEGSAATLNGNTVSFNTASISGGGLFVTDSDDTLLNENTIISNTADFGGGLQLVESTATVSYNTVSRNTANQRGGGLYLGNSGDATLSGNTVISNSADSGGGLFLGASAATLSGNTIMGNTANQRGGGLYLRDGSDATLANNIVAHNRASIEGSGLYIVGSSPRLLHITIARNTGGDGSGVYVDVDSFGNPSVVTLTNNILVSHTVGIYVAIGNTVKLEATLWGSRAWANDTSLRGGGIIFTGTRYYGNPAFVAPDAGNYHIGPGSAAVDAGVYAGITIDIDGELRPFGGGYDIGADEYLQCAYLPVICKQYAP